MRLVQGGKRSGAHGSGAQVERKTQGLSFSSGRAAPPQCPRKPVWQHASPAPHSFAAEQLAPRGFFTVFTRGAGRALGVTGAPETEEAAPTDAVGSTIGGAADVSEGPTLPGPTGADACTEGTWWSALSTTVAAEWLSSRGRPHPHTGSATSITDSAVPWMCGPRWANPAPVARSSPTIDRNR